MPTRTVLHTMIGALVGLGALALPTTGALADEAQDLEQSVAANETISNEKVVISKGHVDVGPRLVDGEWVVMARNDSVVPATWHRVENVVIHVVDEAALDAPQDEDYAFLGSLPSWYVIPQTEKPGVVWLGWNTQDPAVTESVQRGVTMTLGPMTGPGKSHLFVQDGTFGKPRLLVDGESSDPQDVWVDINTHVHANWAFSAPGVYASPLSFTAETSDGQTLHQQSVLRFAVGSQTNPDDAFAMALPHTQANMQPAQSADKEAQDASSDTQNEESDGMPLWMMVAFAVAVLLPLLTVFVTSSRRSAAEAAQAVAEARNARQNQAESAGESE